MKQQYLDYLSYNTLILCFTEEQNSIFMQQGEEIELFTLSVMWAVWAEDEYSTHHKRQKSYFEKKFQNKNIDN